MLSPATKWLSIAMLLAGLPPARGQELPDAPSVTVEQGQVAGGATVPGAAPAKKDAAPLPPCPAGHSAGIFSMHRNVGPDGSGGTPADAAASSAAGAGGAAKPASTAPCVVRENPYMRFLNSPSIDPLTPKQKGYLAVRDVADPFNLMTILGNSAIYIGSDAHTAYGPGLRGFGRNVGYSLLQDASGEFVGTFLICSLTGEDPHYHRDPHAPVMRRVGHAIVHTVVGRSDYGKAMPNYQTLLGYPAGAVLSNLYVPGVATNLPSTMQRIGVGLATDPIGNLITEFLPDVAKHVHIRVVFVQRILNGIATGEQL